MRISQINFLSLTLIGFSSLLLSSCGPSSHQVGSTEITRWQYNKTGAISITYDDGTINQFRVAVPIMNKLAIPATFFIITGEIPGSQYKGKFIGRPVDEIIKETKTIPTNKDNFFERASAVGYLGKVGTLPYHTKAGDLYEAGKFDSAYQLMDDVYKKVRTWQFPVADWRPKKPDPNQITWDSIRMIARQGYEFASHTITHPKLAVLDEPNLLYELQQSKEEIKNQLGMKYTFSAECPYGTEDPRAIQYALKEYPLLRNVMPDSMVEDIDRFSDKQPYTSNKEYVRWQRGILQKTTMDKMKSWVDTTLVHNNIWLVLVIHGIDSIGWEALPHEEIQQYFQYMKEKQEKLWIATFQDVAKYMRERKTATVEVGMSDGNIEVTATQPLDTAYYTLPLTFKTYIPDDWRNVSVTQGDHQVKTFAIHGPEGAYVMYQAVPDGTKVVLAKTTTGK